MHVSYDAFRRKESASKSGTDARRLRRFAAILASLALSILPALGTLHAQSQSTEDAVRAVLTAQQDAWNHGDVNDFMSGYESSDATTFVGNTITKGYRQVLENYRRRYPTKAKMGRLTFSAIPVTPPDAEVASLICRVQLQST